MFLLNAHYSCYHRDTHTYLVRMCRRPRALNLNCCLSIKWVDQDVVYPIRNIQLSGLPLEPQYPDNRGSTVSSNTAMHEMLLSCLLVWGRGHTFSDQGARGEKRKCLETLAAFPYALGLSIRLVTWRLKTSRCNKFCENAVRVSRPHASQLY